MLLAQAAAKPEKEERDAARRGLDVMQSEHVDEAMIDLLMKAEPPVRAELARSLAERNAKTAVPALLENSQGCRRERAREFVQGVEHACHGERASGLA